MIPKKILTKEFDIQVAVGKEYKEDFTPEMIKDCKDFLPGDIIVKWKHGEQTGSTFGGMDNEERTWYWPIIVVQRKVEETDDEYFNRIKSEERIKKEFEQKERLEYLRLKAKFEPEV